MFFFFFSLFNCVCVCVCTTDVNKNRHKVMALSHICAHLFHHKISNRSHSLLCTDANTFSQNIKMGCLKFTQQTFDDIPHHDTSHSYDIPRDALTFMAYIMLNLTLHLQRSLLHHDKPHAAATSLPHSVQCKLHEIPKKDHISCTRFSTSCSGLC